ncbi:MAG: 50S ribosomal protein L24 [Flavobacteriaceae bacterium]|jgi:large subunit ribosomal protein L24|nr:50S ribosomal protein L24 [Flavobacteriaceae bacterium]|tara:strand:- start:1575 stop:1886 length:312 start_codon:yes stop_codon:yes gene_type:complete
MKKFKIRKGDNVRVIAGAQKGNEGKVIKIVSGSNRVIVEGINLVKKHTKPNAQSPQGGIVEKEASIDISNISIVTSDGKTSRIGYRIEDDKKIRFSKKSNEII